MSWYKENLFDESSLSAKSTEENEILNLELLYSKDILLGFEKSQGVLNLKINQNKYQNDIIFQNKEQNEEKLNHLINNIFCEKKNIEEFDDLSYKFNENNNNNNNKIIETNMLGKKRLQDNSTNNFSQVNNVKNNVLTQKIFEINKVIKNDMPIYRLDYYKKIFIKNFLRYLLNYTKNLIFKCNFEENIRKKKLHMPNYKLYAGNPKEKDNKDFLKKTIKKVFMDYDKLSDKGVGRQKGNEKLINKIYEIDSFPSTENENKLNEFFNMTIEKGIELYYESDEFQLFKNDKTNQYYDKMFYNEKNRKISLFEKNGFIKLVKLPFYSKTPK